MGAMRAGGAAAGSGLSSGGEKPRRGKASLLPVATRATGLGLPAAMLSVSFELDQLAAGVEPAWVLVKWLPRLNELVPLSLATLPMRSGITNIAKPTNESEPSTRAAQGVHRLVSTLGIPYSRIRPQA
jgi:hypothetical protein